MNQAATRGTDRPEFMAVLGLLPPYTLDDVQKAYKARAREAHPDRGGANADFLRLREAYEQAQDYVKFIEGRRMWLAAQVEPYLQQQQIVAEIERRGGQVEIESIAWMERSFGDFATLAERLRGITLRNCADGDAFLKYLGVNGRQLRFLRKLDVGGSALGDSGLESLFELRTLARINLAGTRVTRAGIEKLAALPELEWINVAATSVGWWSRWRIQRRFPGLSIVAGGEI
ncbi:MAG TPA: J domain-containing protein [Planctomycetaceae bacterium]|nr:J domain-containing protein [Planctomycetaceae bacterium]